MWNVAKSARAHIHCRKYCRSYRAVSREPLGFLLTYRHNDAYPLVAPIFFFPSMCHEVRVWRSKIRMIRFPRPYLLVNYHPRRTYLDKDSSVNCSRGQTKLTCHHFGYRFIFRLRGPNSCLCRNAWPNQQMLVVWSVHALSLGIIYDKFSDT